MQNLQSVNHMHETVGWGAIFLWWGIAELLKLPNGMDALGIGLILLGLTVVRTLNALPTSGLTITLGIVAVAWGLLDLSRSVVNLPLEASVEFAALLIVLGLTLLALGVLRNRQAS